MAKDTAVTEQVRKIKFLTFHLHDEIYAIDIGYVTEIVSIQDITKIPRMPHYVKGIMNLRGKIVPVISTRLKIGLEEVEYTDRTCIVIINYEKVTLGLIVDSVSDVVLLPETDILPFNEINYDKKINDNFVSKIGRVGNDVKLILDPAKIISNE